jgi:hypothetical protein
MTVNASPQQSWVRSLQYIPPKTVEFEEKLRTGGIGIFAKKKLLNEKDYSYDQCSTPNLLAGALLQGLTLFSGTQTGCRRLDSYIEQKKFLACGPDFSVEFSAPPEFSGGVTEKYLSEPLTFRLRSRYSTTAPLHP